MVSVRTNELRMCSELFLLSLFRFVAFMVMRKMTILLFLL